MMKKLALVCALVMLVSIVSAFAATSDTPIKTQTKLQQKAKIQDGTSNEIKPKLNSRKKRRFKMEHVMEIKPKLNSRKNEDSRWNM